jgi:hypothetical protein
MGQDVVVAATSVSAHEASSFLARYHRMPVRDLERLGGGFWSAAYGYRVGERELVARFGESRAWFEMDRAAMAFEGPDLPVPEVVDVGDAFGGAFAISVRHRGRFLEDIDVGDAASATETAERLLAALRAAGSSPGAPSTWYPAGSDPSASTWRQWILDGLVDDPSRPVNGWRRRLAETPALDSLFDACAARVHELAEACPERRDLVHGDLLHKNVLLSHDLGDVAAVFSWKCSVRGDFLFDVAWCTFWSPWYPGIAAIDFWRNAQAAHDLASSDLTDAQWRHHCYELHIGCTHLGWSAWTDDTEALLAVARRLEHVVERGPLVPNRSPDPSQSGAQPPGCSMVLPGGGFAAR